MTIATAFARQAETAVQAARTVRGPSHVEAAVREASQKTGVDFSYLMEKAAVESGFRTDIKASTSSATGLYQFIDSTWLNTVKEHGAKHGLGQYAAAIQTRADGRPSVADAGMKQEILDLRKDPKVSALMAAEFARDNKEYLEKNTDGQVGSTELYLAHFLGAGGAAKFLNGMQDSPNRQARDLFPDAASSNKAVFFDKETGKPKTLKEIYDRFAGKFSESPASDAAPAQSAVERVRRQDMPDGFTTQVPTMPARTVNGTPLSIYQVLALNALETPDEVDSITGKPSRAKNGRGGDENDRGNRRMRDEPVRTDQTADTGLGLGLGLSRVVAPGVAMARSA